MRLSRDQLVLGAVAAAVLVAIVVFAAANSGVQPSGGRATPAPRELGGRPLFGGSLEPRVRYRTRSFVPALSFAVGDTEWMVENTTDPDRLVLERRRRTSAPGSELPPRSFLAFTHVVRSSAVPVEGRSEPVTVAGVSGRSFHHRMPDGTPARTIVLASEPDELVIDLVGQTQRDLDEVEAPAADVLRTLRIGAR